MGTYNYISCSYHLLTFPSSFYAISNVKEDAEEESDCEECSKRSTCQGLFLALQLDSHLINVHYYSNI